MYLFFFASDTDLENTLQEFFHIIKINSGDIKSGGEEDSWRVHIGVKCFFDYDLQGILWRSEQSM